MTKKGSLAEFFSRYPPTVGEIAIACADVIRSAIPDATETLDDAAHVVGYAIGPGYSGLVCTIIPSRKGVKLGVVRGAALPDPRGLLEGTGKRHRYVQLNERSDLDRDGIVELLKAAQDAASPK